MSRLIIRENWRVEIEPYFYPWQAPSEDDLRRACEEIKAECERHVNGIRTVRVVHDSRDVCRFCREPWETVEEAYIRLWPDQYSPDQIGMPVCCDEAQASWRAQQTEALS